MKCLLVKPWEHPKIVEIASGLESLQKAVGGMIQAVYPYDDPVAIVCNEEGKLLNLPANRLLKNEEGIAYDILCGDFLIVGLNEENFADLSDELIEKYMDIFW